MAMIDFELEFQYAEEQAPALRLAKGSIPQGRCVVLCGGSGCGKSTLLRCINGLIPSRLMDLGVQNNYKVKRTSILGNRRPFHLLIEPMIATVSPGSAVKLIFASVLSAAPG